MVKCCRRDGSALRKRDGRLARYAGILGRAVDDEYHRLLCAFYDVYRAAYCIEIVGRWSSGNEHQISEFDDGADQARRLGRCIDDNEIETPSPRLRCVWETLVGWRKNGCFGFSVPPPGETALRVSVDQDDRPLPCPLGLHGEVASQGVFTGAPFGMPKRGHALQMSFRFSKLISTKRTYSRQAAPKRLRN